MTPLPKPSALLFDWDNTLVDTWPVIFASFNKALEATGRSPWDDSYARAQIHRSAREMFPIIFGADAAKAEQVYYDSFQSLHLQALQAMPDALELLEAGKACGIPMAVVSNKRRAFLHKEIQHMGWQAYFQAIISAGDVELDKPHPLPAQYCIKQLGLVVSPDVWFIGDTITDMMCAHNCGISAILINALPIMDDDFSRYPPDIHVKKCFELTEILTKTCSITE